MLNSEVLKCFSSCACSSTCTYCFQGPQISFCSQKGKKKREKTMVQISTFFLPNKLLYHFLKNRRYLLHTTVETNSFEITEIDYKGLTFSNKYFSIRTSQSLNLDYKKIKIFKHLPFVSHYIDQIAVLY
jgi:hypothetical protein